MQEAGSDSQAKSPFLESIRRLELKMNRSLETGSHVIAKTSSPVTTEQSRLQLPMEVKSRTALSDRVAFNHMWLVSISVCLV